uniref:PDZ domain-containing protein n=1 Tax=Timema douglasi TaxID=61478 RepID=A0A7R8VGY9_TIMDO|nr:unnamed protein product [Timema douglasi]
MFIFSRQPGPTVPTYDCIHVCYCRKTYRKLGPIEDAKTMSADSCTNSSIMKRTNPQGMVVNLRRGNVKTPWGIRIVGGVDLDTPFVVTRVQAGSPADGELQRGDLIKKIGDYDARDLRHEDAQNLFKSAGNTISLAVKRSVVGQTFGPTYTPFQESVGGDAATTFAQEVFQSPSTSTLNKSASVVFPPPLPSSHPNLARPHSTTLLQTWANPEEEDTSLSNQVGGFLWDEATVVGDGRCGKHISGRQADPFSWRLVEVYGGWRWLLAHGLKMSLRRTG